MKKFWTLFLLSFIFTLSTFAQQTTIPSIFIQGRTFGAGTSVAIPLFVSGYNSTLQGFQLEIGKDEYMSPNYFNLDYTSFQNWTYVCSPTYITPLKVAAVGDQVILNPGNKIGEVSFYIKENSSTNTYFSNVSFTDGKILWSFGSGPIKIINLPLSRYDDVSGDGKFDINDAKFKWNMVGTVSTNDTLNVAADLDGNGFIYTYDVILTLSKLVDANYVYPIFRKYNSYNGMGKIAQATKTATSVNSITAFWKKTSDGKFGLFSDTPITNGDLVAKNNSTSLSSGSMFKTIGNKVFFVNLNQKTNEPIMKAPFPIELTGTVNNGIAIQISTSITAVDEEKILPKEFTLAQNYPNPFNPSTTISYSLPAAGFVTLKVYNVIGEEVATLVNETKSAGSYNVKFDASNLPSGTYVYRISAGKFVESRKMLLTK